MSVHHDCLPLASAHVLLRHWQPRPPQEMQTRLLHAVRARSRRVQSGHAWLSLPNLQNIHSCRRTTDTLPRQSAKERKRSEFMESTARGATRRRQDGVRGGGEARRSAHTHTVASTSQA